MKALFSKKNLLFFCFFAWFIPAPVIAGTYEENDGMIIMEMENTSSPLGLWKKETSLKGYTGTGYLQFTGNSTMNGPAKSPLEFEFKINKAGIYHLHLHAARDQSHGQPHDHSNDVYVRVEGDFDTGGNAPTELLKKNTKYYGGNTNLTWVKGKNNLDANHKKWQAFYKFKSGQTYKLVISGRSKWYIVNRILFRHVDTAVHKAQDLTLLGESPILPRFQLPSLNLNKESLPQDQKAIIKKLEKGQYARCVKEITTLKNRLESKLKRKNANIKKLEKEKNSLKLIEEHINEVFDAAISEITFLESIGDVYQLNEFILSNKQKFSRHEKYDKIVNPLITKLKTKEVREEIKIGKQFYSLLNTLKKSLTTATETKKSSGKSKNNSQPESHLLEFANTHKNSIYSSVAVNVHEAMKKQAINHIDATEYFPK